MEFTIEFEREVDGRWIAEIPSLPGTMAYGATVEEVLADHPSLEREDVLAAIAYATEQTSHAVIR